MARAPLDSPPAYGGRTTEHGGGGGATVRRSPPPPRFAWSPSPASQGRNHTACFDIRSSRQPSVQGGHVERGEAVMPEPADVGGEERPDVRDAVFQHGEAIEPAAEGIALIALRIDAAHGKHARMHHAGAA